MLTTNGTLVPLLEKKLSKLLGIKYIALACNGTVALEVALKTLNVKKGILTSPFSYISTPNAGNWIGLKTIFSDIEVDSFSLDINKIKKKELNKVDCIIPTHVFSMGKNLEKIIKFSSKNKKKLIFDAAHCFDVKYKGKSILNYGDISILSFQATKIFNTCEGGAIICKRKKDLNMARTLINIGYNYNKKNSIPTRGTNAKMSELNAAWGLALLHRYKIIQKKKGSVYAQYLELLDKQKVKLITENYQTNFNYFPILFKSKKKRELVISKLKKEKIYARKYFYPSLNTLKHLKYKKMPISEDICNRILCLPIYEDIKKKQLIKISKFINLYG